MGVGGGRSPVRFSRPLNLTGAEGLYIDCALLSDEDVARRAWKMTLRTDEGRGEVVYQAPFEPSVQMQRIKVPFADFRLVRGPIALAEAPPLANLSAVYQIGFTVSKFVIGEKMTMLENFRNGSFHFGLSEIGSYSKDGKIVTGTPSAMDQQEVQRRRSWIQKLIFPVLGLFFNETFPLKGMGEKQPGKSAGRANSKNYIIKRFQTLLPGCKAVGSSHHELMAVVIEAAAGRIFRLETSEGDKLQKLHDALEDVDKGGRRMLSLGPVQFKGHEVIADAVEHYTGEMAAAGRSFSDPTFALVDYSELMNSKRSPTWIPDTAYRGMTLHQLHEVLGFMGHQAFAWHEAHRGSPDYGYRIPEEKFNLYHASYWIINPATKGYGLVGCSLVELIAEDVEMQKPRWFVSHAWLEPITLFVANLSRHAHVRQLELNTAFWVCAYANNQHHLEADVGVVLLLDDQATPFMRIWCCFEEAIAVEKRNATERRHKLLLDVCATDIDGVAHVITDGLAGIENQMVPLLGLHHKTCREMTFPMRILQKGLFVNILSATASHEADRTRILNSIAFPSAPLEELSATPPREHDKYQTINCALSAQFALASWCNSILHGWDPQPLAKALLADKSRRMVQLSFTGCTRLCDSDLAMLVNHLPQSLEVLRLDLGFTGLETLAPLESLGRCSSLVHLELRFPGCKFLHSMAGLGTALQVGGYRHASIAPFGAVVFQAHQLGEHRRSRRGHSQVDRLRVPGDEPGSVSEGAADC
eukprot:symbB.v1.2.025818.t1/scaffold2532.1/size76761/4